MEGIRRIAAQAAHPRDIPRLGATGRAEVATSYDRDIRALGRRPGQKRIPASDYANPISTGNEEVTRYHKKDLARGLPPSGATHCAPRLQTPQMAIRPKCKFRSLSDGQEIYATEGVIG